MAPLPKDTETLGKGMPATTPVNEGTPATPELKPGLYRTTPTESGSGGTQSGVPALRLGDSCKKGRNGGRKVRVGTTFPGLSNLVTRQSVQKLKLIRSK